MEPFVQAASIQAEEASLFLLSSWVNRGEGLTAGFTGRNGGESGDPWQSLNLGLHVGDDPAAVVRNRQRVAQRLGWPFEAWTCAEQVHGSAVHKVEAGDRGRGRADRESAIADTDALMTDEPGTLLVSFYADCVPLYFYDPLKKVVALAHAGWRGTAEEIALRTVESMTAAYGCRPETVLGAIGPSIGSCCYEVGGAALERMRTLVGGLAQRQGVEENAMITCKADGKADLDLKETNRQIMIKAGILPSNIEVTKWCTGCRRDLFFSHRMEGGATGRMASWIGMESR
ncbi:peptidoglycan editing factor PgeF [Paenibacillus beijingensis]|uniref:Purine nucleoside phosphorylase n=1 Tax=Paenibacillus beijingensis TaxID=1126833 RepID=A0A0D5NN73_9BACL|nr:peptidoglycan editing factor PgeF [Paenibacillus beijingensis]AJY76378.1 multicopper polyphenol oxidase [Paenibacillus beijingensis]